MYYNVCQVIGFEAAIGALSVLCVSFSVTFLFKMKLGTALAKEVERVVLVTARLLVRSPAPPS